MRTLSFVLVVLCIVVNAFGQIGTPAVSFQIGDRVAVPGSVIRVKAELATPVPVRGINFTLTYRSDSLVARPSFWANWEAFPNWMVAQRTTPEIDRIAMASRYSFTGSAVLGSFRVRLARYVPEGKAVAFSPFVTLNDTIQPLVIAGSVIAGPNLKFGDIDRNGKVTVGDVVLALDIAIPDSNRAFSSVALLAADVSGDGNVDTYDCRQILYKVVSPEFRFDAEDWEGSGIGISMPGGGSGGGSIGSSPLLIEEINGGVVVKTSWNSAVGNSDFTVVTKQPAALEIQEGLRTTFYKSVREASGYGYRVGFVKSEPLAGNMPLLFLPGVRAAEIEVRGTVNEGFAFTAGKLGKVTEVESPDAIPEHFALAQNYPNPFNPTTVISFALPQTGKATLKVYDFLGREVATLIDGEVPAGNHEVSFDASRFSSGIYIYRFSAGGSIETKRMVLLK